MSVRLERLQGRRLAALPPLFIGPSAPPLATFVAAAADVSAPAPAGVDLMLIYRFESGVFLDNSGVKTGYPLSEVIVSPG